MKKLLFLLLFISFVVSSCQTNEMRAEKLIKNELSEILYDSSSYSPIETTVTKAKQSIYTDSLTWSEAINIANPNISSFYLKYLPDFVRAAASKIDPNKTVGWEVVHQFRCKNKFGGIITCNYRFVVDKDFTRILVFEDLDSEKFKQIRNWLESQF